jgi:hypothetical protein
MNFYLDRTRRAIERVIDGITNEELVRHPVGKWCIAEILEHLSLTYAGTANAMQRFLQADQRPASRRASVRELVARTLVVNLGYMPQGRKSPEMVQPKGAPPDSVIATLWENFARMDQAIVQCVRRHGAKVKLANHPVLGALNATEWSKFHWVHARHHLKQIERLRAQPPAQSSS